MKCGMMPPSLVVSAHTHGTRAAADEASPSFRRLRDHRTANDLAAWYILDNPACNKQSIVRGDSKLAAARPSFVVWQPVNKTAESRQTLNVAARLIPRSQPVPPRGALSYRGAAAIARLASASLNGIKSTGPVPSLVTVAAIAYPAKPPIAVAMVTSLTRSLTLAAK